MKLRWSLRWRPFTWARAAPAADPRRKYGTLIVTLLIFFAIAAWAIPWPGRVVGRPLFRTTF